MHTRIFIAVNIYACLVSEASPSRRRNRADEYFLARTGNPRATFRARDTKDGEEEALHGWNFVKFAVKGVTPSVEGRNMPKKLFSCDVSTEFSRLEGISSITYLDYYARLIGKIISRKRDW